MLEKGGLDMTLSGKRVLIVEDEYIIAAIIASEVTASGGKVVMAKSVAAALDIVAAAGVDGAILEIKLMGERTFRVADALVARRIPFMFATGMSHQDAPARHANVPWLEKPCAPDTLRKALEDVMCPAKNVGC
jgi:CheY-like chemotaxis protein